MGQVKKFPAGLGFQGRNETRGERWIETKESNVKSFAHGKAEEQQWIDALEARHAELAKPDAEQSTQPVDVVHGKRGARVLLAFVVITAAMAVVPALVLWYRWAP